MQPQINHDPTENLNELIAKMQTLDAKIKRRTPADFIKKIRREGLKNERIWGQAIRLTGSL